MDRGGWKTLDSAELSHEKRARISVSTSRSGKSGTLLLQLVKCHPRPVQDSVSCRTVMLNGHQAVRDSVCSDDRGDFFETCVGRPTLW